MSDGTRVVPKNESLPCLDGGSSPSDIVLDSPEPEIDEVDLELDATSKVTSVHESTQTPSLSKQLAANFASGGGLSSSTLIGTATIKFVSIASTLPPHPSSLDGGDIVIPGRDSRRPSGQRAADDGTPLSSHCLPIAGSNGPRAVLGSPLAAAPIPPSGNEAITGRFDESRVAAAADKPPSLNETSILKEPSAKPGVDGGVVGRSDSSGSHQKAEGKRVSVLHSPTSSRATLRSANREGKEVYVAVVEKATIGASADDGCSSQGRGEHERSVLGGGASGYVRDGDSVTATELMSNTYDDWASTSSSTGPFGALHRNTNDQSSSRYYRRLVRFYERYNPDKIARAEEFLKAYTGDEEELFKALVAKYGPEPEADLPPSYDVAAASKKRINASTPNATRKGSGNLAATDGSGDSFHFVGHHAPKMPDKVSPADGRTETATPYWPLCRNVTDRDILELFTRQKTDNAELRKCFIGFLAAHPLQAWNGMTYLSSCALPTDVTTPFLGHTWSGTLANNKTLLFKSDHYRRTVLHCTEECQRCPLPPLPPRQGRSRSPSESGDGSQRGVDTVATSTASTNRLTSHGRWRLVIYHVETCPYALFRVMFDPILPTTTSTNTTNTTTSTVPPPLPMPSSRGDLTIEEDQLQPNTQTSAPTNQSTVTPTSQKPPSGIPSPRRPTSSGPVATDAQSGGSTAAPHKKSNFFTFSFSRKSKERRAAEEEEKERASRGKRVEGMEGAESEVLTSPREDAAMHPSQSLGAMPAGHGPLREPYIVDSTPRSLRKDASTPAEVFAARGVGFAPRYGASSEVSSHTSRSSSRPHGVFDTPSPHAAYYDKSGAPAHSSPNRVGRPYAGATMHQPSQPVAAVPNKGAPPMQRGSPQTDVVDSSSSLNSIARLLQGMEARLSIKMDTLLSRVEKLESSVAALEKATASRER